MNIFQGTLMHELGHAFGMDHTDHIPFKSVLKSTAQFYGRTMHVECLDAKLYCELWGCVNSCKLEQLP
jgi:predicted Zn-dependent protease